MLTLSEITVDLTWLEYCKSPKRLKKISHLTSFPVLETPNPSFLSTDMKKNNNKNRHSLSYSPVLRDYLK